MCVCVCACVRACVCVSGFIFNVLSSFGCFMGKARLSYLLLVGMISGFLVRFAAAIVVTDVIAVTVVFLGFDICFVVVLDFILGGCVYVFWCVLF